MGNKKRLITFFLLGMLVLAMAVVFSSGFSKNEFKKEKVDKKVFEKLNQNEKTKVIVTLKERNKSGLIKLHSLEDRKKQEILSKALRKYKDMAVLEINKEELSFLESLSEVEEIREPVYFKAFLSDSVNVINASKVWPLKEKGINLTGIGETICVIDTGINYTHPDLFGKNKACNIDCYNKSCIENCSLWDDNGHGTHVTGILAASGGITGVAPNVNFIGLKVLNSGEFSSENGYVDLINAIDWCVENRVRYNISVISMSLGTECFNSTRGWTGYCYNTYCDGEYSAFSSTINNAVSKNISVVAASGNDGNETYISFPACISNVTAVAATNKNDSIAYYTNFNSITDFFAPGTNINSTYDTNKYAIYSGTSMATPHVAAAFSLVRQFYLLQKGIILTPKQIQDILKQNGKHITTSTGINISRINVYNAIISLDEFSPNVSLIYPLNNFQVSVILNHTFKCDATDLSLKNVTFYLWNSSSIVNYSSKNVSGGSNFYEINISSDKLNEGEYYWNCYYTDENNNIGFASSNFSLTIHSIIVSLVSPSNNLSTRENQTFECNFSSKNNLKNVTFYLWNETSLEYLENKSVGGNSNSSSFSYNFTKEGNYKWNCFAVDEQNIGAFASSNFNIKYDLTPPSIAVYSPVNNSWYNFGNFSLELNEEGNCYYTLDKGLTNISMSSLDNKKFNASNYSLLQDKSYSVKYYCNDSAGNLNNSEEITFYVDLTSPVIELLSPAEGYSETASSTTVNFVYNVSDNLNISSCSLIINNVISSTNNNINQSKEENFTKIIGAGSYDWSINCTDSAGNIGNSNSRRITINAPISGSSSGGGGGSGTRASTTLKIYDTKQNELQLGYSTELKKGEKIKFNDEFSKEHHLTLLNIENGLVNISVESSPVFLSLKAGEEVKLNLTSPEYYNLYIKIENITKDKAKIFIQLIKEEIAQKRNDSFENKTEIKKDEVEKNSENKKEKNSLAKVYEIVIVLALIFIISFIVYFLSLKSKKAKARKKKGE